MGTLTLTAFMTLDGFTETSDGMPISPTWSADLQTHWAGENSHDGALLLYGRTSWEFNSQMWPAAADDGSSSEESRAFARVMSPLPKAVVSNTLTEIDWNGQVLKGPLVGSLRQLKREFDGDIVATGGMRLASAVLASGEVDRLRILLMPQVAGSGRSIFGPEQPAQDFELINNQTMDTGAVILTYRPRA